LRDSANDSEVRVDMGYRTPQNLESYRNYLEQQASQGNDINLLICADENRKGAISLLEEDKVSRVAEYGLWIAPEHQNEGYGADASEEIIDFAFNQMNYNKVMARVHEDNKASQKMVESIGLKKEGVLRDHTFRDGEYKDMIYYGILKDEW